jgi:hypothetical protein
MVSSFKLFREKSTNSQVKANSATNTSSADLSLPEK